jgi:hypothetical protein
MGHLNRKPTMLEILVNVALASLAVTALVAIYLHIPKKSETVVHSGI